MELKTAGIKDIAIFEEGVCSFETETKEQFLERIERYIKDYEIEIFYNTEINGVQRVGQYYIIKAETFAIAQAYI